MALFDTKKQRAAWLVAALGVIIVIALLPYATGLLAAPVLYIVFAPMHVWLTRKLRSKAAATVIVLLTALFGIVFPVSWMVTLLVGQAQEAAQTIIASPVMARLDSIEIAGYAVGQEIRELGSRVVGLVGGGAISLLGTVTRITLNLLITFVGLYYILQDPSGAWRSARPFIPFSDENVEVLKQRFADVTKATIIGTGLCALIQGVMVGAGFAVVGLGNPVFWGSVTIVLAILPVVGSGLVWGPGALVLFYSGNTAAGIGLLLWGALVVGNIDNVIRPWVSNKYANVHAMITLVGALAGVAYLGILGLLIGPLALSYFFELLVMYRKEYLTGVAEA